jgi:flagellar hook assembly protein FlgD
MRNQNPFCLILLSLLIGCSLPSALDDPELVSSLRFFPSAFDSFKSNTEIRYTLKSPASLNAFVIKRDTTGKDYLVKTLALNAAESKGSHAHTWLGDTDDDLFAPPGTYIGVIQIQNRRFEATVLIFHF